MERSRKGKILVILSLFVAIVSLTVGFAAFSVSLNILSQASITPNSDTFSVKFSTNKDSLVVGAVTTSSKTSGITASDGIIDNSSNPTIKGLSATFTQPGQYVEYTFYARNEGEYTAYLNNINFLGSKTCKGEADTTDSLVQSACSSINITAIIGSTMYTETTPITGHTLDKKTGEQIKIRLEYDSNGMSVDGAFSIKFPNIAFVYSTLDDSSIQPALPTVRLVSGDLDTIGSEICIKDECFNIISSTEDTVTMLSKMNITLSETPRQQQNAEITVFSSDSKKGNNYNDYSGSIVEGYINNYKAILEGYGVFVEEARLIKRQEVIGLQNSDDTYSWYHSTYYWIGHYDGSNLIWFVHKNGELYNAKNTGFYGVRPVITISKIEF